MKTKKNPALVAASRPGDKELLDAIQNTPDGEEWKCPCCGRALPFQSFAWFENLPVLLARYGSAYGITPDIASLAILELWGCYQWLSRLEG